MNALTLMVWSMALGAIAAVAVARLADLVAQPSAARARAFCYHVGVFLLVLLLSGMLRHVAHPGAARMEVLQVLVGPVCVGLSGFWIHGWLGAAHRERLMATGLRLCALALPLLALALLALPRQDRMAAAAALSLTGSALTAWVTFRAWMLGDRLALLMAAGTLLTLPAIAGLYAMAMQIGHWPPAAQAAVALCAALSNGITGEVLWRRERHAARMRETGAPALDPVTRVHSSSALVHRLVASQKKRRRTRREGALLAITVFDAERVTRLLGESGLHQVWMAVATRIRREVGVIHPVGRYWECCFVVLLETIPRTRWLGGMALRLATSLRQPVEVSGRDGDPLRVWLEVGVGAVHLPPAHPEVEDVLDQAQRLAEAARQMRSRAAMADPDTGEPLPVEEWLVQRRRPPPGRAAAPPTLQRSIR